MAATRGSASSRTIRSIASNEQLRSIVSLRSTNPPDIVTRSSDRRTPLFPAPASASPTPTPGAQVAAPSATAYPTAVKVQTIPDLIVARNPSPATATRSAIEALGGMSRYVRRGQTVVVKPNICISQEPVYAATTNPEVVATLVTLCLEAGAAKVLVMDGPFAGASTAYGRSGIETAVRKAGGEMQRLVPVKFKEVRIPEGRDIKKWRIYEDVLNADVLINVPIAKHHNLAKLTLGMKNLMGVVLAREQFHFNIGQRVADLTSALKPTLTVVDAVRILTDHGPTGGNLADVKQLNTVIAGADPVAADAYAATLFGMRGVDIAYVRAADEMGLGTMDLSRLRIGEVG
jgi:uncharacterized protein (DUF362 family)